MKIKILAIGDFHGKFPGKLIRKIKKENPDLILSTGDFPYSRKLRKIIFKYWVDKEWYEVIGLKKASKLLKTSFKSGLNVLKRLNSLNKKSYVIWGNADFYEKYKKNKKRALFPGNYNDSIKKMKNIILVDKKMKYFSDLEIIGHGGYVDVTEYIKNPIDKEKKKQIARKKRYERDIKKLKKLFLKKKPKRGFIFIIHYTPYKCLDIAKSKSSPMYGKHVGFEPYNNIIKKYKPLLTICGHMHEYQGIKKLGKTIVVATGAAKDGEAAVIEIEKDKIKSIKFIK